MNYLPNRLKKLPTQPRGTPIKFRVLSFETRDPRPQTIKTVRPFKTLRPIRKTSADARHDLKTNIRFYEEPPPAKQAVWLIRKILATALRIHPRTKCGVSCAVAINFIYHFLPVLSN